jgi:hypothetical protein
MSFAGKWMELEIMLSEISQTEKKTNIACSLSYAESKPKKLNDLSVKQGFWGGWVRGGTRDQEGGKTGKDGRG